MTFANPIFVVIVASVVIWMALVITGAIAQTTEFKATTRAEGSGRPPATSTQPRGAECDPSIAVGFENCTSVAYACVGEGEGSVCPCFGALQTCLERNEQLKQCSTYNDITAGWTELCFVHNCRGCGTRSTLVGLCRSSVSDDLDRCEENAQQCIGAAGTDKVTVCKCAEAFFRCATGDGRSKTCSRFEKLNATYATICANNGCSAAQCADASVCTESALSALKACFAAARLTENACADPCSCARDVDSCLAADGAVVCESAVAQPNNLHRCGGCRTRDHETVRTCIADEIACLTRSLDATAAVCACRRDFNECIGSARSCASDFQEDLIAANAERCELLRCSVCGDSMQTRASLIVLGALALTSQMWH